MWSGGGGDASIGDDVMAIGSGGCGIIVRDRVLVDNLPSSKTRHDWGRRGGGGGGGNKSKRNSSKLFHRLQKVKRKHSQIW